MTIAKGMMGAFMKGDKPKDTKYAVRLLSRADGDKPLFVGTCDDIVEQMRLNNDEERIREKSNQDYMAYATVMTFRQGAPPPPWDPFDEVWDAEAFLTYLASVNMVDFEGDAVPNTGIAKMREIRQKISSGEITNGMQLKELIEQMGGTMHVMSVDPATGEMVEKEPGDLDDFSDAFLQDVTAQSGMLGILDAAGVARAIDERAPTPHVQDEPQSEQDLVADALRAAERRAKAPKPQAPPKDRIRGGLN